MRSTPFVVLLAASASTASAAGPHATVVRQYRSDTGALISFGGTIPYGVGVYFEANIWDDECNTVKLEVELLRLPATFTGVANYTSIFVSGGCADPGIRVRTTTASGLASGNYGWRYRVVDSNGQTFNWYPANNPDFIVAPPPLPDLQAPEAQWQAVSVNEGASFWVKMRVYNAGPGSAGASYAKLYLSTDNDFDVSDDYYVSEKSVGALASGASEWVQWDFTMPNIGSGSYSVWMVCVVDSRNQIAESEGSNTWKTGLPFTANDPPLPPPGTPSGPSPSNGATNVSIDANLNWADASNATSYDVYFDTNTNPQYFDNTGSSNLTLSTLQYYTTYHWKIVAIGGGGTTQGPVWSFTTEPQPTPTGACCDPNVPHPCQDKMSRAACDGLDYPGYYGGDGSSCASTDCDRCDDLVCEWCWVGTVEENNCIQEWNGDGSCDCGCQFSDSDCATPTVPTPTISPNGGTFYLSQQVSLSCSDPQATIRYTTNGVDPTSSSFLYNGPFTTTATTVKARAFRAGYPDSAIAIATYTVTPAGGYNHPNNCWLLNNSGYGVSFTGANSSLSEVHEKMRCLATAYEIPVEIIGATAMQESGLYQYGSDGFIVHNLCECHAAYAGTLCNNVLPPTPPGLGMMQLTGSTAGAYSAGNYGRLVTDWAFNLEAGVRVLRDKRLSALNAESAALRQVDLQNKHVLENWYYTIRRYNGGPCDSRTLTHLNHIYDFIRSPSGRLTGLFPPVDIIYPEEVIPAFVCGNQFAARSDNVWLNAALNQFNGTSHDTTSGSAQCHESVTYTLPAGFTFVSFPFDPSDGGLNFERNGESTFYKAAGALTFADLFAPLGNAFFPYVFTYDGFVVEAVSADSIIPEPKRGYFIYLEWPQSITIAGDLASPDIALHRDWNSIGVVSETVGSYDPAVFPYAFTIQGDEILETSLVDGVLQPGTGYFVVSYTETELLESGFAVLAQEEVTLRQSNAQRSPSGDVIGTDFYCEIVVAQEAAPSSVVLRFGMLSGATDGFDEGSDIFRDLPQPGASAAFFDDGVGPYLAENFKTPSSSALWPVSVFSQPSDPEQSVNVNPIILSWTFPSMGTIDSRTRFQLLSANNVLLPDMGSAGSQEFIIQAANTRLDFVLKAYLVIAGDQDLDGDVDLADFAGYQVCFGRQADFPECGAFDLDGSGLIDASDFPEFLQAFQDKGP